MIATLLIAFALQDWTAPRTEMGWTRFGETDNSVAFYRLGPRPSLVWQRVETREPDNFGFLSSAVLYEIDCAEGRTRSVQGAGYTQPNLLGRAQSTPAGPWNYAIPGTLREAFLNAVCGVSADE